MRVTPALSLHFPSSPTPDLADRTLAVLDDLDPTGIDEGSFEPGVEAEPARTWRVYFRAVAARDRAAVVLAAELGPAGLIVRALDVADEGWLERSQAALRAVQVGRLIVAPPWDVPANLDAPLVIIHPSTGFGTGHHASTRLCLRALQRLDLAGRSVVDVGTGSGVLAIAAVTLGALRALAIDCDPDALANARENVAENAVNDRVAFLAADLADLERLDVPPADVVLGNLTAAVLERHADAIARLTVPGGTIILSGVMRDQVLTVSAGFEAHGVRLLQREDEDGWVGLTLRPVSNR